MKNALKIGISLMVVTALAMSGLALAATTDSTAVDVATDAPSDVNSDVKSDVAGDAATDVAVTDRPAYAGILERLGPLVEEGIISESQAEAVAEQLAAGMRRPAAKRAGIGLAMAAAEFLGLAPEDLRPLLAEGTTLAGIAEANGSSADALIAHLVGEVTDHLTQANTDGKITDEKLAEMLDGVTDRITDFVNKAHDAKPNRRAPGGSVGGGPTPFDEPA